MPNNQVLIGLDLGQQNDYSVLTIVNMKTSTNKILRTFDHSYDLVFLHKFPLRTTYPTIVKWITWLLNSDYPVSPYVFLVDYTGVGRPVVDLFREQDLEILALSITGGSSVSWKGNQSVTVPKKELVSSLLVSLQEGKLDIAENLNHLDDLVKEFVSFKAKIINHQTSQFSAMSGYHDDIVMSLCLPIWYGEYISKRSKKIRLI
jgi:hypothetical protein